jgi:hypothetical protein
MAKRINRINGANLSAFPEKIKDRKETFLSGPLPVITVKNYRLMASQGQLPMQAPHSMQAPSSMTALSASMVMALTGQLSTQAPQPAQVSLSILAAIFNSPC